ncbi:MAG: hypothetical protein WC889_12620, partial [Myxococcota bacterium]
MRFTLPPMKTGASATVRTLIFTSILSVMLSPGLSLAGDASFDPFVATPARLRDGVGGSIRLNSIPDTSTAKKGTQVSIDPLEVHFYKKLGRFSLGLELPVAFNPDRSKDDYVLQVVSLDMRTGVYESERFNFYAGVRVDFGLNLGISDPNFPDRDVATTFMPYVLFRVLAVGGFAPQFNLYWHQTLKS